MPSCAVKRGFVALRDCGNSASDSCAICGRAICQEHMKIGGTEILCLECHARRLQENAAAASSKGSSSKGAKGVKSTTPEPTDDATWPYLYRTHYYTSFGYHPFYHGAYYDSYYDDYDVRAFDSTQQEAELDGDATDGGFYDS